MSVDRRRGMIEAVHDDLSISAQCRLLSFSRPPFHYARQPESDETLALMQVIDAAFLAMPQYCSRQMVRHAALERFSTCLNRWGIPKAEIF